MWWTHSFLTHVQTQKGGRVRIFGTISTDQSSIQEEIKECLLSFGTQYFVFQVDIQKFQD
jgi:hypothetical protein